MVTLKSSNDNDRPLGVISGFSSSNFKLWCTLLIIWWKWSAVSSISCKGLSLGARRGLWFLSLLETRPSPKRIRKSFSLFTDPLFSLYISVSARMIIKTAGDLFTTNARGVGVGRGFFLFLSRCARAVPWFQRSVLNIPKMK